MHPKAGVSLAQRMQSAQDYDIFDVNIFLKDEPAYDALKTIDSQPGTSNRDQTVTNMREAAAASQDALFSFLETKQHSALQVDDTSSVAHVQRVERFWINNSIHAELSRKTLEEVLDRPDVSYVELARHADVRELIDNRGELADRPPTTRKQAKSASSSNKPSTARLDTDQAPVTWSVQRVNAPLLWQKGIDGRGIIVAVIDSGVNYNHPDLRGQMWKDVRYPHHGYDFQADDNNPFDEGAAAGHGTACAGIVAGNGAKGKATGVAPGATIMAIRVGGSEAQFWRGMQFAVENGAHVVSMSMSWKYHQSNPPDYPGWRRTCEAMLAAGLLHANSIGNQGDQLNRFPVPYNIATPGNCPPPRLHHLQVVAGGISSAISCGATDDADGLAAYSGRGPAAWERAPYTDYPYVNGTKVGLIKPDLCAPGPGTESCNLFYTDEDLSSKPYTSFGGTSAATPHLAGCLALLACACLRSGRPINPAFIQEALENTAVRISGQARDKENHYGAGRVDVFAAYNYGVAKGWWGLDVV